MDFFNENLWGKQFILYTHQKQLGKLGHLHSKMLYRLQTALSYSTKRDQTCWRTTSPDFWAQKKPSQAFDPFQADVFDLQMQDEDLQMLQTKKEWPNNLSKQDKTYFKNLAEKTFQDKNKVVWIRLTDFYYPRTALYLPSWYRKEAMCETHDSVFGVHKTTHKKYL